MISGLSDDNGTAIPAGSTTADAHPHISSTGKAGDTITVYDGSTKLGTTTVDANGKWDFKPTTDLSNGAHDISATDTNKAGTVSPSSDHIAVTVDATTPAAPVITALIDDYGNPILNNKTIDNHPYVNGTGKAGDTVTLYDGSKVLGSAVVDANGKWSIKPATNLAAGLHDLYATEKNLAGTRRLENWAHFPANPFHTRPPADASNDAHGRAALTDNPQLYLRHASKGVDMVALLGDHQVLDLTSIVDKATAAAQIPGIGGFDLGGHHNAPKLSLADVLTLGERDLFLDDGKRQLMVTGQEGDLVDLSSSHVPGLPDSGWEHHGTAEVGGVMYNVVAHSSTHTELLVSQEVQVDLH